MAAKILIIDDEDLFREDLGVLLRNEGHECLLAPNGEEGLLVVEEFNPDIVLCDIQMPGKGGIELLDDLFRINPECCVMMLTAYGAMDTAVEAFRKGVSDYILKPLVIEDVCQKIVRIMDHKRLAQELRYLRRQLSQDAQNLSMIGKSDIMQQVIALIKKVAPTKATVLIEGESGTGKEVVAQAVHQMSGSSDAPFVAFSCAGIAEHLLESEIFGHVRGAFTGAISDKEGYFELAGEGTLFLDEITEIPLTLQVKLLRVLEQREFMRVGSTKAIPLKAQIIASTNRDMRAMVEAGTFREDLLHRLAIFEIPLPPLRQRRGDIPLLIEYFVKKFNRELKRNCLGVDKEVMRAMLAYAWSGNVRELKNVIERAIILSPGGYIQMAELPPRITGQFQADQYHDDLRHALRAFEREHIRRVLAETGQNKEEAARRLKISPSTLYRKMTDSGLTPDSAQDVGPGQS